MTFLQIIITGKRNDSGRYYTPNLISHGSQAIYKDQFGEPGSDADG